MKQVDTILRYGLRYFIIPLISNTQGLQGNRDEIVQLRHETSFIFLWFYFILFFYVFLYFYIFFIFFSIFFLESRVQSPKSRLQTPDSDSRLQTPVQVLDYAHRMGVNYLSLLYRSAIIILKTTTRYLCIFCAKTVRKLLAVTRILYLVNKNIENRKVSYICGLPSYGCPIELLKTGCQPWVC